MNIGGKLAVAVGRPKPSSLLPSCAYIDIYKFAVDVWDGSLLPVHL